MEELTLYESVNADLAKCKPKRGYRSNWVIAEEHNQKQKVVRVKKVNDLPIMMGLI